MSSRSHYDTIVIGVGGMGSAAVYHLASRGQNVLGIEQFDIPNDLGSSGGITRVIRLSYHEDPSYVPLVIRAFELWRELQESAGEQLLHPTGSVHAGPPGSPIFEDSLRSCREHGLSHEVLSGAEIGKRFPGYRLPSDHMGVYQEGGGFLVADRCIIAHVTAAQALGAEIHAREKVLDWEVLAGKVRVETDRGMYEAEKLVIAAGAWASKQVPLLASVAVPERQVLGWFQPLRPELFTPEAFPVFGLVAEEGRFYGFPVFGVPGFKVGKYHHFGEEGDPDELDRELHPRDEDVLRTFTERYFPDAAGPTMALKVCMFTNTPDGHFIIGTHPDHAQVMFAAGFSGHGFKFSSIVGEILADLAVEGETTHDIRLFDPRRFSSLVGGQGQR
jgi:sarcosine oxidase